MKVYAFEWCDCVYESAFGVVSLHDTKKGAYVAMRKRKLREAARERDMQRKGYRGYRDTSTAARVRAIHVATTRPTRGTDHEHRD